jgi:hypothetical protein
VIVLSRRNICAASTSRFLTMSMRKVDEARESSMSDNEVKTTDKMDFFIIAQLLVDGYCIEVDMK